jgi:hypothetical protein
MQNVGEYRPNGPIIYCEERLARWADTSIIVSPFIQGDALGWANGWTFGPSMDSNCWTKNDLKNILYLHHLSPSFFSPHGVCLLLNTPLSFLVIAILLIIG